MGNFLTNPLLTSALDGSQVPMNPAHFASPQGAQFALGQLQRVLGMDGTPVSGAPTAGPYSWPGQMQVNPETYALDGTPLGGMNLGAVASMYEGRPQADADAMLRLATSSVPVKSGASIGLQGAAPATVTAGGSTLAPMTSAASSPPTALGLGGSLPLSFSEDLLGQKLQTGDAPKANPQVPQSSAFAPTSGQNQGMGMAQLSEIVKWLMSQGVKL